MTLAEVLDPDLQAGAEPGQLRLHISPFNPALLSAVIPPAILPVASNISYHTLQTFPDRNFGYVDLPTMDAKKVKKRLHGSILKGTKVKVEEARNPRAHIGADGAMLQEDGSSNIASEARERRSSKRRRKDDKETIPGVDIPGGRKIQRGWTTPASAQSSKAKAPKEKKQRTPKSTYTTKAECLFRTNVPLPTEPESSKKDAKRAKRSSSRGTVIHEFSGTTKHPAFLRDQGGRKDSRLVSSYDENKGWLDEQGNVIEAIPKTRNRSKSTQTAIGADHVADAASSETDHMVDAPPAQSQRRKKEREYENPQESEEDDNHSQNDIGTASSKASESQDAPETSSSASSSASSQGNNQATKQQGRESSDRSKKQRKNPSNAPTRGLSITIPSSVPSSSKTKEPHPLETIFKRPLGKDAASTAPGGSDGSGNAFNFFDSDEGDDDLHTSPGVPQTPFTQRDFQNRALRSAAPTPDTAAPGKTFPRFSNGLQDQEGDSEEDSDEEGIKSVSDQQNGNMKSTMTRKAETKPIEEAAGKKGFEELFWEKRGESNRTWKRRRREAGKERRKRENQRLEGQAE
ncbi:MAG: hypothetical protein M1837_002614 [Sclerophora amabilis]|nr:MAG: hypothetical protein M1837_002614 [Sclerophora amabilis]